MSVRVIRRGGPQGLPRRRRAPLAPGQTRIVRAAQVSALAEAEGCLARARADAEALVERARGEAETVVGAALERARAEAAVLLARARHAARRRLERAEADLSRLAVAVAEKLLGAELLLHPDQISRIVEQSLRQASAAERVLVRVSPTDLPHVHAALPRLAATTPGAALQIEADPSLAPGGCVVETEQGEVDGRLEVRVQTLLEALESAP